MRPTPGRYFARAPRATAQANLWFDINPGRRALGKLDTATERSRSTDAGKHVSGGRRVTIDVDGRG